MKTEQQQKPVKTFRVIVKYTYFSHADVEAENFWDAFKLVLER